MQPTSTPASSFLRAIHRRWIIWRTLERAGMGVALGCAASAGLIAIHWLRGEPALQSVVFVLALGAIIGLTWGIARRPTMLETAIEADRQLRLDDLLATTLLLPRCQHFDDAARATIAAMADARCEALAPSQLILNRLGARAWSGVGLASALVLSLSLLTAAPTPSRAGADTQDRFARDLNEDPIDRTLTANGKIQRSNRTTLHRDPPAQRLDENLTQTAPDDSASPPHDAAGPQASSAATAGDGTGAASAQTQPPRITPQSHDTPAPPSSATGDLPAGGAGTAANAPHAPNDRALTGTSDASPSRRPAPWNASTWSEDRARALRAVERGEIPHAYRHLVREYFERDPH